MDALNFVIQSLDPLTGRKLIDIGCGNGGLVRALVNRGGDVTGLDIESTSIEAARRKAPNATFLRTSAMSLPFRSHAFDGVVFLNSLHHLSDPYLALCEAVRVVHPGCRIIVVEPAVSGSYHEAMRLIEDETVVRRQARDSIMSIVGSDAIASYRETEFVQEETFMDAEQFVSKTVSASPERALIVDRIRPRVVEEFERVADRTRDGRYSLSQPLHGYALTVGGR